MTTPRRADMFAVRSRGETEEEAMMAIRADLKVANIEAEEIHKGHTQPDGSTVYFVYKRLK